MHFAEHLFAFMLCIYHQSGSESYFINSYIAIAILTIIVIIDYFITTWTFIELQWINIFFIFFKKKERIDAPRTVPNLNVSEFF